MVGGPPLISDGPATPDPEGTTDPSGFSPHGQHGPSAEHLPAVRENVEPISKLEMSTPAALRTPETANEPVLPGQIADLAVYKSFAYLNSWSEPTCRRGGIFVVDISNPAEPRQVAFRSAAPNTRHGEGAHVITVNTPIGPRDVLAVNNEPLPPPCDPNLPSAGGIDLWMSPTRAAGAERRRQQRPRRSGGRPWTRAPRAQHVPVERPRRTRLRGAHRQRRVRHLRRRHPGHHEPGAPPARGRAQPAPALPRRSRTTARTAT